MYIGELLAEANWLQSVGEKQMRLRLRFRGKPPLGRIPGEHYYFYYWQPYNRLPTYLDTILIEVEGDKLFTYLVKEASPTTKWPPGPGYSVG